MDSKESSILCIPNAIALLVNESAIDDFNIFIKTLMYWNSTLPTLYIYTTSTFPEIAYKGRVVLNTCLDIYSNLTRKKMESMPSQQGLKNYFHDFTLEKCNLMSWAIDENDGGVLFCDADICWMAPLPSIPEDTRLGLSPHYIRHEDEKKFGTFNAGFLYIKTVDIVEKWLLESLISDFYEQYSLNILAKTYTYYTFGPHINYGWWRMFQAPVSPDQRKAEWVGLTVKGKPLICIHTHFNTKDPMTREFNTWILDRIKYNKDLSILLASE